MDVKVTKDTVSIIRYTTVNEGEAGVNACHFQLPEEFSGLTVTAAFNSIPVPVINGECLIPTLKKGTVVLGVYAYKEGDEGVTLMYSPKPTAFYVNEGSYIEEPAVEDMPTIGEYEKYCTMFSEYLARKVEGYESLENRVTEITEASTHQQYPSAKAVYELVGNKEEIELLDEVALDDAHTHNQVYSAGAMDEAMVVLSEAIEGGGGNARTKTFEKIAECTVVADSDGVLPSVISISKDSSGNDFELTDFYCDAIIGLTDGANGKIYVKGGDKWLAGNFNSFFTNTLRKWHCRYDSYGENNGGLFIAPNTTLATSVSFPNSNVSTIVGQPVPIGMAVNINRLELGFVSGTAKTFVEGTTITLWGVRK